MGAQQWKKSSLKWKVLRLFSCVLLMWLLMAVVADILFFLNLQLFLVFARPFLCIVQMPFFGFQLFLTESQLICMPQKRI